MSRGAIAQCWLVLGSAALAGCASGTPIPPAAPAPPAAGAAAPSTDIYVYRLNRRLPLGSRLFNITNRRGYDNQPFWDGSSLLYTSARGGQTDIFRYQDGRNTAVTATPESEYSPGLTPDGKAISVVRVERDSTQRLWRFPIAGGDPQVLLPSIKPVGYYAWLDSTLVALFVLGSPNSLQIADVRTGASRVVTTGIGRSLQRVPRSRRASFVRQVGGRWQLETVNPVARGDGSFAIDTVALLPDSAEYVVWRDERELYTAAGRTIFRMRLPRRTWEPVAELADLSRLSRLAISPDGRNLAVVAEDQSR